MSTREMRAAIIRNLPEKAGKDIEAWKAIARSDAVSRLEERAEKVACLQH